MSEIIILQGVGQYEAMQTFSKGLHKAFLDIGISAILLDLCEVSLEEVVRLITIENPKLCISFNAIGFNIDNAPYYTKLGVNHLAILVDHPIYHIQGLDLTYKNLFISCVDNDRVNYLKNFLDFEKSFPLYHGVDKDIEPEYNNKTINISFLGSITDYNNTRFQWKSKYNEAINMILDSAIEIGMYNSFMPTDKMLDVAMDYYNIDVDYENKVNFHKALIPEIDSYLRAYHRVVFLRKIKHRKIIYGNGPWDKYIKNNATILPALSMKDTIDIMRTSKITLNCSMTTFYNGSHERPFMGTMAGSYIVSNYSPFFHDTFMDSATLVNLMDMDNLDDKIAGILCNDEERMEHVNHSRNSIIQYHTWNNRANEIVNILGLR